MITYFHITEKQKHLTQLNEFQKNCWVCLTDPSDEEIEQVDKDLGLEENLLRDALDVNEVPRIELEDDEVYLFSRFLYRTDQQLLHIPILFVLDKNCLLTVSTKEFPQFEKLARKLEAFDMKEKAVVVGKMLFIIMREYHKLIIDVSRQVQAANANLHSIKSEDIVQLVSFENTFHDLLSSLVPTHIAVGQLLSGKYCQLAESDQEILLDVHLFINQLIEMCRSNLERVMNLREATDTIISHNLNATMKFLAIMTLIFTIPTMIFSFFGMNVALPLQNLDIAHFVILTAAIFISFLLLFVFIRKHLL